MNQREIRLLAVLGQTPLLLNQQRLVGLKVSQQQQQAHRRRRRLAQLNGEQQAQF